MKELKKYISESLLDDEDDLISNVKKDSNDLFSRMITAVDSKMSSYDFYKSLDRDNCIDWIYENFPSLKQFKLHFDLNNSNGSQDNKHGFARTHKLVRVGISMYKKNPVGNFICYDIMTFEYDKTTNTLIILGKSPVNVTAFTYWDTREFTNFKIDLNNFIKKYDLEKINPGDSYLKRRNMQWGCTKKI